MIGISIDDPNPGCYFRQNTPKKMYLVKSSLMRPSLFFVVRDKITLALAAFAALAIAPVAFAASDSWTNAGGGGWAVSTNWFNGTAPGSTTTDNSDVATFGVPITVMNKVVNLDVNRYIGGISFDSSGAIGYGLTGGTLHLNNGGVIQTLAGNGDHTDATTVPIVIDGNGGTAFFTAGASSSASLLSIGGPNGNGSVSGVSTAGNTTTLVLNGTNNTGGASVATNIVSCVIADGTGGGNLALVKSGSGTWYLNAANTFTGGVTVKEGTLIIRAAGSLGTGSVVLGDTTGTSSATLLGANQFSYANAIVLATNASSGPLTIGNLYLGDASSTVFTGGVTGTNNLFIAVNQSGGIRFTTNAINNAGTITNNGIQSASARDNGTVTISEVGSNVTEVIQNSSSPMTIATLDMRGSGLDTALTNVENLTSTPAKQKALTVTNAITGAGNLVLKNNSSTANVIVLTGNANNTGTVTNSGTGTGGLSLGAIGSNVTGVIQNSTTSKLTLTGVNTYAGATTISAGTLVIASAGTIDNSSGVNLGTAGSQGTLDLTSKNGFTFVSSQKVTGYGNVTMAAGKTLTVNGALAPGDGVGKIAIAGGLTLGSTATTTMDLLDSTQAAGTGFDQVSLTLNGKLTYGGTLTLNVTGSTQLGVYHLFTGFSSVAGTFTDINYSAAGVSGSFNYATGDLTLLAVPEPGTWALAGFGLGLALLRLRSRRRSHV
jgi:autotransporter-associated beta strand protein